ncbi:phage major capsid protein [Sinomonas sp. ASV486]|uniref:phage major capsid protein n=1 Tax=Sinomonas sp. ASV486 TaxID=3051170 RepID=UPI0027DC424F|nr:phage major capsid protein [Sinomonas sp. ASV486]MDQ4491129.1 phage major capsid protein [Sinomonas sp. ASV486]
MSALIEEFVQKREACIADARAIVDAAEREHRSLTTSEDERFAQLLADADTYRSQAEKFAGFNRQADAAGDFYRQLGHRSGPGNDEISDKFREVIRTNSREPVDVFDTSRRAMSQPGLELRALSTSTATLRPTNMYASIVECLTESSAVLKAGATLLTTDDGGPLVVPRSTGFSTAAIVTEGSAIGLSDPALGSVTLGSYKYGVLVKVSRELVDDTTVDLAGYLGRETGTALGIALGAHLINGTGTGQPRGVLADATLAVTGPTGTATTLGAQGTAGQGTDLLNSLMGSVLEPYATSRASAFLLRNASLTIVRNLKTTAGDLVGPQYVATSPSPFYVDPNVPAFAANAKSVLYGDWSRYFVRFQNGIRFERSDDFAFDTDQVTFRALLRADGGLIDLSAIKFFQNSAT